MHRRTPAAVARVPLLALAVLIMALVALPAQEGMARDAPPTPLKQPTDQEMGVPTYPGAKFDGQMSAGMSQGETYFWVFATTDPVEKVVTFYKEKTRSTPAELEGSFLFTLKKGKSELFPALGVMVEKNTMFPGPAKSVVTVTKAK
jgi:hypothetical protein